MDFIKNNKKRLIALAVFALVIVFNVMEKPEDDSAKTDKSVTSFGPIWESMDPAMEDLDDEELYENVFSSRAGDFYRLSFSVKSIQDDRLNIVAMSFGGNEEKIGEVDLIGEDKEKYFETTFATDGEYQDIYVERMDHKSSSKLDNRIFIYDFSLSRLDIGNQSNLFDIGDTIFGETEIVETFLSEKSSKYNEDIFSGEKEKMKEEFTAKEDNLLFVDLNLAKIGTGGEGEYLVELFKLNEKGDRVNDRPLKKIEFFSKKLKEREHKGGFYRFEFQIELEKGRKYEISVSNKDVKTDVNNYIEMNRFGVDEGGDSYIRLITIKNKEHDGKKILTGAKIEDIGTKLIYRYNNKQHVTDWADVFEGNDFNFDWRKDIVMGEGKTGSYFTYKIDTIYPFEQMRVKATQYGKTKDEISMLYSYDNSTWNKMKYTQEKGESQIFDFQITNNNSHSSEMYIRVSYDKKKEDDLEKQTFWGLEKFNVSAYLKKEKND